jgi:ferrous iron transport protein B
MTITVALAGNPNTGKSSLFNALTGSRQHVGNWPGKTVAKHEGCFEYEGTACRVVDLPGTYSLSATSPEEIIARDYLLSQEPDLVVLVVDASNLERNLYLTAQVLEMGVPSVIALNMTDVAVRRGDRIDVEVLGRRLGTTVVPTVARTGSGVDRLRDAIVGVVAGIGTP